MGLPAAAKARPKPAALAAITASFKRVLKAPVCRLRDMPIVSGPGEYYREASRVSTSISLIMPGESSPACETTAGKNSGARRPLASLNGAEVDHERIRLLLAIISG